MKRRITKVFFSILFCAGLTLLLTIHAPVVSVRADAISAAVPKVTLDIAAVGPRAMENQTERSITRDYGHAWQNLAEALDQNSPELLNAYFVGSARRNLSQRIHDQGKAGIHARYLDQNHDVQAVFYAPEGDAIELHDTAACQLQIVAGRQTIHDERAVLHYVVLMTPGADRWVIRQLQAVPSF